MTGRTWRLTNAPPTPAINIRAAALLQSRLHRDRAIRLRARHVRELCSSYWRERRAPPNNLLMAADPFHRSHSPEAPSDRLGLTAAVTELQ